jgi:hypothetical protein
MNGEPVWGFVCRRCGAEIFVAGKKASLAPFIVKETVRQSSIHEMENPGHKTVEMAGTEGPALDAAVKKARSDVPS